MQREREDWRLALATELRQERRGGLNGEKRDAKRSGEERQSDKDLSSTAATPP
jgi:hypothetical protein